MENKRSLGTKWERIVADYLRGEGYVILEMNYRTRYSEIDVIAQDSRDLVFVEVKYRSSGRAGDPLESITASKIKRIRNAALYYLRDKGYDIEKTSIRFDAVGVLGEKITHIKNAF
ncbi:MAG: YraN family protein [Eubacterium sp.]|nr:YraN family protein [Eubacterium sp.]